MSYNGFSQKKRGFFNGNFRFFPYIFVFKNCLSKSLSSYINIYISNTSGGGPAMRVFFFGRGCPNSRARQAGMLFPRSQHIPGIFDAADRAQAPGEAGGKQVLTLATSGSLPDQARVPVCHPESRRSFLPATYPYWEYPVSE